MSSELVIEAKKIKKANYFHLNEKLKGQYDQNVYSDVILVAPADGTRIYAHRDLLAASSRFFSAMFCSGMRESYEPEVQLNYGNGDILHKIIDFCYSDEIEINQKNVEVLLSFASYYEFNAVEDKCEKYLQTSLKNDNTDLFWYYSIAMEYNLQELNSMAKHLIETSFMKLRGTEEFYKMDFNQMYEITRSGNLIAGCEEDIFDSIIAWINYGKCSRLEYAQKLLSNIRWSQISETVLIKKLKRFLTKIGMKLLYDEIMYYKRNPLSCSKYFLKPRNALTSMKYLNTLTFAFVHQLKNPGVISIKVFTKTSREWFDLYEFAAPILGSIYTMQQTYNTWFIFDKYGQVISIDMISFKSTIITHISRRNYGVAVYDDFIYVVGGLEYNPKSGCYDIPAKSIEKYDLIVGNWSYCASLLNPNGEPLVTAAFNKLYCVNNELKIIESFGIGNFKVQQEHFIDDENELLGNITQFQSSGERLFIGNEKVMCSFNLITRTFELKSVLDTQEKIEECKLCESPSIFENPKILPHSYSCKKHITMTTSYHMQGMKSLPITRQLLKDFLYKIFKGNFSPKTNVFMFNNPNLEE